MPRYTITIDLPDSPRVATVLDAAKRYYKVAELKARAAEMAADDSLSDDAREHWQRIADASDEDLLVRDTLLRTLLAAAVTQLHREGDTAPNDVQAMRVATARLGTAIKVGVAKGAT